MALGRTWAQATLPWTGDTETWDLGTGTVVDTPTVGVVDSAILTIVYAVSDAPTLSLLESSDILVMVVPVDTASVGFTEAAEPLSLVDVGENLNTSLLDFKELLIDDWPQVVALPVQSWDKENGVTGLWTKAPPDTSDSWH